MGLYALFLAGSNYFAPVIAGFIADYHGWKWVFYWPSIFLACSFFFLFFFMEETNYHRETLGVIVDDSEPSSSAGSLKPAPADAENEKTAVPVSTPIGIETPGVVGVSTKSFWQKMALWDKPKPKNLMFMRAKQSLIYLSWPVVFYAG
jgi:MFS family permease